MKLILITMNTYQVVSEDEIAPSLLASDSHRGGGYCVVYRKRTSTRCPADGEGAMQDTQLHGRSDENFDSEEP